MSWVRIDDGWAEHPKFEKLGPVEITVWLSGLSYCNRNLTDGFIPESVVRKLGFVIGNVIDNGVPKDVESAVRVLVESNLWIAVDNGFLVHHYADYQQLKKHVERQRKRKADNQKAYRDRASGRYRSRYRSVTGLVTGNVAGESPPPHPIPIEASGGVGIPPGSGLKPKKGTKSFTRPSLEEVKAYCSERSSPVDPEAWMDHYTSNGWMVGKNPMRDWKAAVRTWERTGFSQRLQRKGEAGFARSKGAVLMELGKRMQEGGDGQK